MNEIIKPKELHLQKRETYEWFYQPYLDLSSHYTPVEVRMPNGDLENHSDLNIDELDFILIATDIFKRLPRAFTAIYVLEWAMTSIKLENEIVSAKEKLKFLNEMIDFYLSQLKVFVDCIRKGKIDLTDKKIWKAFDINYKMCLIYFEWLQEVKDNRKTKAIEIYDTLQELWSVNNGNRSEQALIEIPQIFLDGEIYELFNYLVEAYDNPKTPSKFSHIFHFIEEIQGEKSISKVKYLEFLREQHGIDISKIHPTNSIYFDRAKGVLMLLKSNFKARNK